MVKTAIRRRLLRRSLNMKKTICVKIWRTCILAWGNSKHKGPEAGASLA
jgi:hypothetical protein